MNSDSSLNEGDGILKTHDARLKGVNRCYICRKLLPMSEFHKTSKNRPGGLTNECKTCASNRQKGLYKGMRRLRIQYQVIARRAKRQSTPFHITFEDFCKWEKKLDRYDSRICPYCGLTVKESKAFQQLRGKKRLCGFTVDRIDNTKGYSLENIQRICFLCNAIKGLWFTSQEMEILGPYIQKIQRLALR